MDLERQVQDLAKRVAVLEAALQAQVPIASPVPLGPPIGPPTGRPVVRPTTTAAPRVRSTPSFEWGIESVLRWAGIALVTLAGIFLVSTAVTRGWIGPELQLLCAALGGAAMTGGAVRVADSRRPWALAAGCGGTIVLIASALATHAWLDVVGPGPAVVLAGVAVAVSIGVALQTRLEGVAVVAGVVGMVAPFGTLDNFGDAAILGWITAFILGTAALGLVREWAGVRIITTWLGALMCFFYAAIEDAEGTLLVAAFVGATVIGVTLWLAPTLAKGSTRWLGFDWTSVDYRLVALVPAWAAGIIIGLLSFNENDEIGSTAVLTAAAFLLLAERTFGHINRTVSISTLLGAFGVLAVGLAIYFDGPALMVALAGQAITSYVLGRRLGDVLLVLSGYLAGLISTLLAAVTLYEEVGDGGFDTLGQALATAIVVACWVGATFVARRKPTSHEPFGIPFEIPLLGAWAGVMMWVAAALTGAPQGLLLISVAWTLMACAGLVVGLTSRLASVKNMALATLALTLAKLVTVDLAEVDVFWRVGLFFVIGMGLITLGLKVPSLVAPAEQTEATGDELPADHEVQTF